jgi:hypothetical protein
MERLKGVTMEARQLDGVISRFHVLPLLEKFNVPVRRDAVLK